MIDTKLIQASTMPAAVDTNTYWSLSQGGAFEREDIIEVTGNASTY